ASRARRGGAEWMRARRDDPVERYQRQEREETDQTIALAAHQARAARVTPVVTYTIVGVISVVTGIQFLVPGLRASIIQAALIKSAVLSGEWWRLITSAYLHGSLLHWLANMSGLLSLGSLIEIYDRRSMIPLVFVASAIGGALASTLMLTIQPAPSLGASGRL